MGNHWGSILNLGFLLWNEYVFLQVSTKPLTSRLRSKRQKGRIEWGSIFLFVRPVAVGPGYIPSSWVGFLEPIHIVKMPCSASMRWGVEGLVLPQLPVPGFGDSPWESYPFWRVYEGWVGSRWGRKEGDEEGDGGELWLVCRMNNFC